MLRKERRLSTMIGMPGMKFAITVSALDCTGCGSCANVCPGKKGEKALVMENMEANEGCTGSTSTMEVEIPVKARSYREIQREHR